MKISAIEVYQLDLPYAGGVYELSGGRQYTSFDATLVRVVADNGLDGWGESTPFGSNYLAAHAMGARAGIAEIAPQLLGADPRCVDRINDVMDDALSGHNHAKAAIDIACWDLYGKSVALPVHMLLGGSTGQRMPVISSIHAASPDDMRRRVNEHRARGYLGHSIKIGASQAEGGPALDADRIASCMADKKASEFFLVDANGGLTPETALRIVRLLPDGLDFVLEAPCATWRETRSLRARCQVPIHIDELAMQDSDVIQAIAEDAAEGIGLKISKAGGLTHARRHRDICLAAGMNMSVQDTVGSTLAFAGILQLAQTVPSRNLRCVLDVRDMVTVQSATLDAPIVDGGVLAPDAPGLGVTVDSAVLGKAVAAYA